MKSVKQVKAKLEEEKAEANNLLAQYNQAIWDTDRDRFIRLRSKVQERIISLEWVLGIGEC